jgi:FAD/FMN-containing dehydrogenase
VFDEVDRAGGRTGPVRGAAAAHALDGLRRRGVEVYEPGEVGYEATRQPWNVAVDQRPAAVALPVDAGGVAAVVRAAAELGLRVAPQSTGHNAGPLGPLDRTVLLRTGGLDGVAVDPAARRCRVGSGAVWEPVVDAAAPHGLAALHGSSPDVGVAGYTLGGGIGWYARKLGLASGSLTAVELVTADAELVRADAEHDPELFWALRGGGGNFGVVTALEFALHPVSSAYAGALVWDVRHAGPVLQRWADWSADAPEEVTTSFRILRLPPDEAVPAPLRGREVVVVDGAVLADDEVAVDVLRGLRELRPELDTFGRVPAAALVRLHGDPEAPTPVVSDHTLLDALTTELVEGFVAEAGPGSGSTLLAAELRQLGGALGRPHPGGGAVSAVDGAYALFGVGVAGDPATAAQVRADAARLRKACAAQENGRTYLNFVEHPIDAATAYPADTLARLSAVRARVDPTGLIQAGHPLERTR